MVETKPGSLRFRFPGDKMLLSGDVGTVLTGGSGSKGYCGMLLVVGKMYESSQACDSGNTWHAEFIIIWLCYTVINCAGM